MNRLRYEMKNKLDRLNGDLKAWLKQVDYGIRLWSTIPDTTLQDLYEQVLTQMWRKLESANYRKVVERQTVVKRSTTPERRLMEYELRKSLEMEMLKSVTLLENLEREKIKVKRVEEEMRDLRRQLERANMQPKYIVTHSEGETEKEVDNLVELDKQIAEQMEEMDIPGSSFEGAATDRSGGLSTDRPLSEQKDTATVITEIFKAVYNNEWGASFNELTRRYTEDHAIELLRRWLKECYYTCIALTKEQRQNIKDDSLRCFYKFMQGVTSASLTDKSKKYIRTFQRKIAKEALPLIEKLCIRRITKGQNFGETLTEYIKRCSEICWMMNVHHPAIFLDFDLKYGYVIDKNSFATYKHHGDYTNYVVWPAVYAHKNGPLLCKGIVESQ